MKTTVSYFQMFADGSGFTAVIVAFGWRFAVNGADLSRGATVNVVPGQKGLVPRKARAAAVRWAASTVREITPTYRDRNRSIYAA